MVSLVVKHNDNNVILNGHILA